MAVRAKQTLLSLASAFELVIPNRVQTITDVLASSFHTTRKLTSNTSSESWRTATKADFSVKPSALSPLHVVHHQGNDRAAKAQIIRDWLRAQPILQAETGFAENEPEIQSQLESRSTLYGNTLRRLQQLREKPNIPDLADAAFMHAYYDMLAAAGKTLDDNFLQLHQDSQLSGDLWKHWLQQLAPKYSEIPSLEAMTSVYNKEDPEKELQVLKSKAQRLVQKAMRVRTIKAKAVDGKYRDVGRRKTSVALVVLKEGSGQLLVNGLPYDRYFQDVTHRAHMLKPFVITSTPQRYDVMVAVRGGGLSSQAQASAHGISKAMARSDVQLQPLLSQSGLLKRDKRVVERKKPGRKKARKSFTWVKR